MKLLNRIKKLESEIIKDVGYEVRIIKDGNIVAERKETKAKRAVRVVVKL